MALRRGQDGRGGIDRAHGAIGAADILDSISAAGSTGDVDITIGAAQAAAIAVTMGDGDDSVTGLTADVVTLAHQVDGGAGTDLFAVTDVAAATYDFTASVELSSFEQITLLGTGAAADTVTFDDADVAVSQLTLTITNSADGEDDVVIIEQGTTAFEAAAEASLADVNAAGEYFLDNTGGTDGVLSFYNEEIDAVTSITLVGLDAGAVAGGGDLTFTA